MLKRIILVFGILIFTISAEVVAKQEYFEMTADKTEASASVTIRSVQPVKGFQFKVVCDTKFLELETAEKGTAFDGAMVSRFEDKDGVLYALAAYSSQCEAKDICALRFKIKDLSESAKIIMQNIKVVTETESLNVPDISAEIEADKKEPEQTPENGSTGGGGSTSKTDKNKDSKLSSPISKYVEDKTKQEETKKEETERTIFSDIEGHWGKADILFLNSKGIINGISETLFSPDTNVTRAEFCALISRTLGLKETADNIYSDVKTGEWYEKPILECTASGFVKGDGELFRPNDIISRQEMAVIISRVCGYLKMEENTEDICGKYADEIQIEGWARKDINNVVGHLIMKGYDENHFAPLESATRAQAAAVIRKIYDLKNTAEEK